MPSWDDGETSNGSLPSEFTFEPDVPESIYDPGWSGIDAGKGQCHHLDTFHQYVAFEGTHTGRRFLGCGRQVSGICDKMQWVDGEWPDTMKNALLRLWHMYEEEKERRTKDALDQAETNFKLVQEKRDLQQMNYNLKKELSNSLSLSQVAIHTDQDLELQKSLRQNAEKERDKLKEDKKKLEYYIADLLKAGEANKQKLKKISQIFNE